MAWLVVVTAATVAVAFVCWIIDQDDDEWPAI